MDQQSQLRSPKISNTIKTCQIPRVKTMHQEAMKSKKIQQKKRRMARTATRGCPWWLLVAALLPPIAQFSFVTVLLLCNFTRFELQVYVLKLCIWLQKWTHFIHPPFFTIFQFQLLDQIREKEGEARIARIYAEFAIEGFNRDFG